MKATFVDTSEFLAALDQGDRFHTEAAGKWATLARSRTEIWTTDYVRLESWSLIL